LGYILGDFVTNSSGHPVDPVPSHSSFKIIKLNDKIKYLNNKIKLIMASLCQMPTLIAEYFA
jgi:hypothetical protein